MKVQLLSDLHLEWHPDFLPQYADGADVLVLAGDIGSYQRGSRLDSDDFGLERFSPRLAGNAWRHVLFVPGNHEFDLLEYQDAMERMRRVCDRCGIVWLDREIVVIDAVRFVGSTLWSDFDAIVQYRIAKKSVVHVPEGVTRLTWQFREREKAFRAANFYLSGNTTTIDGEPVLAERMRELGLDAQVWLRAALQQPHPGPTVAVTHFAPSLRSHDPRFGIAAGTAGFCNALDDLLPLADVWMHGHLHCPSDYTVKGFRAGLEVTCRVVANPMGYRSKGEQARFDPLFCVDIPERTTERPRSGADS